jgi:hypothetical protein
MNDSLENDPAARATLPIDENDLRRILHRQAGNKLRNFWFWRVPAVDRWDAWIVADGDHEEYPGVSARLSTGMLK